MTAPITTLQPDQLADLRLLGVGATRKNGAPWECSRARLAWFALHGYVEMGPSLPAGDRMRAVRRSVTVTVKGWEAIVAADAAEGVAQ